MKINNEEIDIAKMYFGTDILKALEEQNQNLQHKKKMTLEEIKQEKKELEKQIEKLVNDFSIKHDITISSGNITQDVYNSIGSNKEFRETKVKIVIEL